MSRNYTVQTRIEKPVADVFRAVVSHQAQERYFTDGSSGDLVEGATVTWHWERWGDYPAIVDRVVPNERVELRIDSVAWKKSADDAYDVRVIFEFEALDDGATMLSISEAGWKTDADGLKGSHENCSGWTHMAMCLKAWIEHDLDLR